MPEPTQDAAVRRFGAFEINLQSGELRKNEMRRRLSGQPLQVLAVLVERAGEVVTREELHSKLWPGDTYVDFDHGLNNAVARIREVLDDSSGTPRYVETIPRRGYRFIAPVTDLQPAAVPVPTDDSKRNLRPEPAGPSVTRPSEPPAQKRFIQGRIKLLLMGSAVVVVFATGLVRGAADEHFWSETYDREMGDVLALKSDVAKLSQKRSRLPLPDRNAPGLSPHAMFRQKFMRAILKDNSAHITLGLSSKRVHLLREGD